MHKLTKFLLVVIITTAGVCLAWYENEQSLLGIDDANIYFVYMQNLANGYGFVFNEGGERVEGFTSLLWTLIGSICFLISTRAEMLLLLFNIFIISFTLWRLIIVLEEKLGISKTISSQSLVILGILLVIPGYFEWTVLSLLETGLWSSLLILTTLELIKKNSSGYVFNLLLVLLVICRPESVLWGGLFILLKFIKVHRYQNNIKIAFSSVVSSLFIFTSAIATLWTWRYNYFGFIFPNTYYAKISDDWLNNIYTGFIYVIKCFLNNPLLLLAIFILPLSMISSRKWNSYRLNFDQLVGSSIVGLTLMIPLYTGGDHFSYSRFIQPTMPVILMAIIITVEKFNFRFNYTNSIIIVIVASFIPKNSHFENIYYRRSPVAIEWKIALMGRKNSEQLNLFFADLPAYPSQGVYLAGGSSFAYKGFSYDLLGLNNIQMAHESKVKNKQVLKNHGSFNKQVFYRQLPDIIRYGSNFRPVDVSSPNHLLVNNFETALFQGIHFDEEFQKTYAPVAIHKQDFDTALFIYASYKFLASLDKTIYSYRVLNRP